jgi:diacylglycerol O-acyltransferase
MARYEYQRLSSEAATLLEFETSRNFGHTCATMIFEPGPLAHPDGGVDFEAVCRAVEAHLHEVPTYRRKLRWIPLENHPVWVDDEEFNLSYHVRHTSLPSPGTKQQLRRLAARVQSQRLDRSRPLWEFWVAEGLEGGRFALITKTHGALAASSDGDLLQALLSPDPESGYDEPAPFRPQPMPSVVELMRDELVRQLRLPRRAVRSMQKLASGDALGHEIQRQVNRVARMLGYTLRADPHSPLNGKLGPHRSFDHLVLPLNEIKRAGRALGGTVLDAMLCVVTGAIARYLAGHYINPATLDFRVAIPVGLRSDEGDEPVGEWVLELPIWESDVEKRFEFIRKHTKELARRHPVRSANDMFNGEMWSMSNLSSEAARAIANPTLANLRLTNVPFSQSPLYVMGAKMLEVYAKAPLIEPAGLSLSVHSYDGKLCWGINADFDMIPDLSRISEGIADAHRELVKIATRASAVTLVEAS